MILLSPPVKTGFEASNPIFYSGNDGSFKVPTHNVICKSLTFRLSAVNRNTCLTQPEVDVPGDVPG